MQEKIQMIEALLKEAYDIFDTLPQGNGSGFFAGLTVVDESGERKSASHNFVFHTGNTKEGATKFAEVILKNIHKEKARPLAAILSLPYLLPEGSKLRGVWDVFPEILAADKAPVLDPDSLENSLRIAIIPYLFFFFPRFFYSFFNNLTVFRRYFASYPISVI